MTLTQITEKGIKDGEIINADINASAAIAGTKVAPNFGSQNIVTTGSITGNDLEIDSGTLSVDASNNRVGINETSPDYSLHVNSGSANSNTIFESTDTAVELEFKDTTGTSFLECRNDFRLKNSSGEKVRIDSSGRVLIGQTDTTGIQGSGDDLVVSRSGNMGLTLRSTDGSYSNIYYADNNGAAQGYASYQHSTDSLQFATATNERMRIDSTGRVLIGTTSVGAHEGGNNFTIAENGHCGMTIRSSTSTSGNIYFADGTSSGESARGEISYRHATDDFRLFTAGNERMRITSSGQLLIGTTSTSGISAGSDDIVIGSIGDSTVRGLTFATTASAAIRWADAGDNAMGRIEYNNSTDVMTLHTSNATRLRLDSDGIKFGSDSAASTALDDYEEGSWTPTQPTVGMYSDDSLSGHYQRIGNFVHFQLQCRFNSNSSSVAAVIDGFPFNSAESGANYDYGASVIYATRTIGGALIHNGGSRINLYDTSGNNLNCADMSNKYVRLNGFVEVS